jgi:hypothetical protein
MIEHVDRALLQALVLIAQHAVEAEEMLEFHGILDNVDHRYTPGVWSI